MLVGSLFATSVGAVLAAGHDNTALLDTCLPANCQQVADGVSLIEVSGEGTAGANGGFLTISGASFVSASGGFTLVNATRVNFAGGAVLSDADDWVRVQAPAAAGTATITVWTFDATLTASAEGTFTLTFFSAAALDISPANSTVTLDDNILKFDGSEIGNLTVVLKDGNGTTVTSGATVSVTILPIGVVALDGSAAFSQAASDNASPYAFDIKGSGFAGAATVTVSVFHNGKTTQLGTRTVTFSGDLASSKLENVRFALVANANTDDAVRLTGKDSAGNDAPLVGTTTWTSSPTGLTVAAGSTANLFDVACPAAEGTYTLTAKTSFTNAQGQAVSVTSNPVTIVCSTSDGANNTFTVAFGAANVAPGGSTTLNVTIKNAEGLAVPDTTTVAFTPLVSSGALGAFGALSNGVAKATYLAPFASGQVSAVVSVVTDGANALGSKTATLTIGAPATAAGTKAGLDTAGVGPFTTTTKVVNRGQYVTYRFDLGLAAAGKPVVILGATKTGLTWSGFAPVTTRIANSQGVVIWWVRHSTATWRSYRAQETTTNVTPARQARWR